MRKNRILGVLFSAMMAFSAVSGTVYAKGKEDSSERATMCFDSNKSLEYITPFGENETGLTYSISSQESLHDCSLVISEKFSEVPAGEVYAGIKINSADLGLDSFAGCKLKMNIFPVNSGADSIEVFAEGDSFMSEQIRIVGKPRWTEVSLNIPDDRHNDTIGIIVTSTGGIKGPVCYVDDLDIIKATGKHMDNIGDYQKVEDAKKSSTTRFILMILLFVVLLVGVVGGVSFFIYKYVIKRYR